MGDLKLREIYVSDNLLSHSILEALWNVVHNNPENIGGTLGYPSASGHIVALSARDSMLNTLTCPE